MTLSFPHRLRILAVVSLVGILLTWAASSVVVLAEEVDPEEAYTRTIQARAEKIVDQLGLSGEAMAQRVIQTVADQYRGLREIHDARDAEILSLQSRSQDQEKEVREALERVQQESLLKQCQLHRTFVAKLAAELSPEEVNDIKDGMTYGVLPTTYERYLQMLPDLTEEQKRTILALLIEAREYAMDAGSSDEKHGWFRKYKGKINNYLSSAGYKM